MVSNGKTVETINKSSKRKRVVTRLRRIMRC